MDEFENSLVRGIHISRYIASWTKNSYPITTATRGYNTCLFIEWLKQLIIDGEPLTDDEIWRIYNFTRNGKLELESNAKAFMRKLGLG